MGGLELVFLLLVVCVALRVAAERFSVPYASALVVAGLAIALVPGLPTVRIPPDVIFLVTVPPLLFGGAQVFPLRDLRTEAGAIARLAIGLVLVSAAAVAAVVRGADSSMPWAAALTLGAIVAAPDSDAALWAMRSTPLARTIEAVLEGEGLLNDAAAVLVYRMAVSTATGAMTSVSQGIAQFIARVAGGTVLGLIVARLSVPAHRRTRALPAVASTVSLLTPYAAFISAEALGASGVLAVVVVGIYSARHVPQLVDAETRAYIRTMWAVVIFVVESLMFILVGLELPNVTSSFERSSLGPMVGIAALVAVSLIVVRMAWVLLGAYVFRGIQERFRGRRPTLLPIRVVSFVAWAGLRGSDSLMLALSIPLVTLAGNAFPARDRIVFIAFCVVVISLVVQGPTIAPLAQRLGVFRDATDEKEEAHARVVALEAGLEVLKEPGVIASTDPELLRRLRRRGHTRARRWVGREEQLRVSHGATSAHLERAPRPEESALADRRREQFRRVQREMLNAERRALLALRDRKEIADEVMRRVQRELDLEELLIGPMESRADE